MQAPSHPPPRPRAKHQKHAEQEPPERFENSDTETTIADDDDDDEDEVPKDVDLVIAHLTLSKDPVIMSDTHNNTKIEERYGSNNITAFAKICGREWTYYVQDSTVNIGRELSQHARQSTGAGRESSTPDDATQIHIDLGPSKVISRLHATITYDYTEEVWRVEPHGRNGVQVDDKFVKKGSSKPIRSGSIIAIAGTEMLFQVPNVDCDIDQRYKDRVVKHDEEQDEGGLHEDFNNTGPYALPYYGPGSPYAAYPGGMPGLPTGGPQIAPAPAPAPLPRPVTPEPLPLRPMMKLSAKKRSPTKSRGISGMMMESTEQIDYSLDSSKDIKPACSYAAMITWAILSTEDGTLSLNNIYQWIKDHYAYYRFAKSGWQVYFSICQHW